MKERILENIYRIFEDWSRDLCQACRPSCSHCCTDNVTITADEGVAILRFVAAQGMTEWFSDALARGRTHPPTRITTNEYALACLEGRETDPGDPEPLGACPFLGKDELCRIYPVRPFACRLFASTRNCGTGQSAIIPEYYLEAATAVTQLVEHLGQREYYGNMLDVLPALVDYGEFRDLDRLLPPGLSIESRIRTLTARPLPGLLLTEDNREKVDGLLETIFRTEIDGRTVKDILNGR